MRRIRVIGKTNYIIKDGKDRIYPQMRFRTKASANRQARAIRRRLIPKYRKSIRVVKHRGMAFWRSGYGEGR